MSSPALRGCLQRVVLAACSVLFTVAALELFFYVFVEVTDNVDYEHLPGVGLKLKPDQQGLYVRDPIGGFDSIRSRFRINGAGFNNLQEYSVEKESGKYRIAVVGDSFVEALNVDCEDALFSVLERSLRDRGLDVEVYSFGVSGFGTAQVYHLIERYVLAYSPDFIIYLFIPNDVADSSPWRGTSQWSQQYEQAADGEIRPLPFERYVLSRYRWLLKRMHLFRYVYYQRRLGERLKGSGAAAAKTDDAEGEARAWVVVQSLIEKIDAELKKAAVPWLLVWQGDAEAGFYESTRQHLEAVVRVTGIPYLDLSEDFVADYSLRHRKHRIRGDGHWNVEGHRVAGTSLARLVAKKIQLLERKDSDSTSPTGKRSRSTGL